MAAKVVSQKKFAKLVASPALSPSPPVRSPVFPTCFLRPRFSPGRFWLATIRDSPLGLPSPRFYRGFLNNVSAQYPSIRFSQRSTPLFTNVAGQNVAPFGTATNPSGVYFFAVVAIGSAAATDHTAITTANFVQLNAAASFAGVTVGWTQTVGAYGYQIWMLNSVPYQGSNVLGSLLGTVTGASTVTYTFTGALPTPRPSLSRLRYRTRLSTLRPSFCISLPISLTQTCWRSRSTRRSTRPLPRSRPVCSPATRLLFLDSAAGVLPLRRHIRPGLPDSAAVDFRRKEILILGNGLPPVAYDPSQLGANAPVALANTFQASYPTWQASVSWTTDAQVTDGTNYYTATQGGVSGTTAPTPWNTAKGAETADGSVIWTSQGPIIASVAPRGAAHAVSYAGSLWLANTSPAITSDGIDGPTCLKMSDSNNPNSWNPVNTAFIGRADGTQITGMQPFTIAALGISPTGSLCVFKEFLTYQVIGVFGSTSFEIQPAQTNLGCLAARSIQFLPGFGVVRYTHLGFAVFDGINDRLISEDIRPYLFGGADSEADLVPVDQAYLYLSQSAQTTNPPMYFCAMPLVGGSGALTRVFCYDLVMKAWAVLDLPWPIASLGTMAGGEGSPLVLAGKTDGTIQRMQAGDVNWDQGVLDQSAVQWSFRTPDVFGEGSSQRLFYEQAVIRGYGSAAMVQSIVANLWLDGVMLGSQGIDVVPMGDSTFEANVKIWLNGQRAHLDISGSGGPGVIDAIDWSIVPKSSQARRIIS